MSWLGLAQRMVLRGHPEPTLRGVIRSVGSGAESENATGWAVAGDRLPTVFTGVGSSRRAGGGDGAEQRVTVWRDGARVRVARPDGSPSLISDGERTWTFHDDSGTATVGTGRSVVFRGRAPTCCGVAPLLTCSSSASPWARSSRRRCWDGTPGASP